MRASPRLGIRVTPCGKALLSPLTAMGSHITISNYSGGGKATQSTSTSTNGESRNECTSSSSSTPNSSPQSFTKLSGLDGHAITPSIIPLSQHASVVWPIETCREIFAPSSSSSPRLFIGKSGEFINNSNSCERELELRITIFVKLGKSHKQG